MFVTFINKEEKKLYYVWGLEYKVQVNNATRVFPQIVYIILPENLNKIGDWWGTNNKSLILLATLSVSKLINW